MTHEAPAGVGGAIGVERPGQPGKGQRSTSRAGRGPGLGTCVVGLAVSPRGHACLPR